MIVDAPPSVNTIVAGPDGQWKDSRKDIRYQARLCENEDENPEKTV